MLGSYTRAFSVLLTVASEQNRQQNMKHKT